MRLDTIFRAQVLRHAQKVALICDEESVTYEALDQRVLRVATGLRDHGLGEGDRIVLFLPNGTEIVELILAAFSIGALVIPVTTRLTTHELRHICSDSKPRAVVFDGAGAEIVEILQAHPEAVRITTGRGFDDVIAYADLRATEARNWRALSIASDDALILYTSGTTGKPKGAIVTHANVVVQNYFVHSIEWGISRDDRFLVTTPLAHRAGFARLANSLMLGGTLVVMKSFDPEKAVATIGKEAVTVAGLVPTICRMMLPHISANPSMCASLRRIVVTGEAFPVELKRAFHTLLPHVAILSFFAMTEAGAVTSLSHEEQFAYGSSIGRPTPGVEVRIVDDFERDVPLGEPGELLVRAGEPGRFTVMREYFNRPEETAKTIIEGWIHTGDIAKADGEGYLYIVDRKKDVVLSGGFNIYTKEVEQALMADPDVADAAVVGIPDAIFGEMAVAFVEPKDGCHPTAETISHHVRDLVAGYKKPKHVFVIDQLPRNSLGKVLKVELRERAKHLIPTVVRDNERTDP